MEVWAYRLNSCQSLESPPWMDDQCLQSYHCTVHAVEVLHYALMILEMTLPRKGKSMLCLLGHSLQVVEGERKHECTEVSLFQTYFNVLPL